MAKMVKVAEEWVKVFACATAPANGASRMSIITALPSNPGRNTVRNICTLLIHLCNPFNTSKSTHVVNVLLKTLPAKVREVLSGPSTLPGDPAAAGTPALVWVHSDFEADGLRLWERQSFGARFALHSPVAEPVRVRPAASPQTASQAMTARAHEGMR